MSEHEKDVSASVLWWLVSKVKNESSAPEPEQTASCKLNDFSSYETYQMIQAIDSEDRI